MVAMGNTMHADFALVQRAKAQDRAAFNEIVLRYKSKVYNYIYRQVESAADAEDLTQETFVRAYLSINSFQSRASLNTWLFRIATNLCIDQGRKEKRTRSFLAPRPKEEDNSIEQDVPDSSFDPQELALNTELGVKLESALRALPEKLRTVILLYDIEGLSYEEISAILDCPLGTIKSRIFNARSAMRDKLAPYLQSSV